MTRDYLKRLSFPRQSYAISGTDWGDADSKVNEVRSKVPIVDAPMIISNLPPGANAKKDSLWAQTYGASQDAFLSLLDGNALNENSLESNSNFSSIYRKSLPLAVNTNLYDTVFGKQQIQFIVGRDTVEEFKDITQPIESFEARGIGIRMPMQAAGWGKTITMRPTDPEPQDPRVNDDEHKMDRSSWKVGPVDNRWDSTRGVWRTWNDLIADDEGQGLGTFVFSTNPDDAEGFPFLRGRLEDVWSVRRTWREDTEEGKSAKTNDTAKSAHVCTKLEGLAYQDDLVAPWSQVLKVSDACRTFFGEVTVGSETTQDAELVILTSTKFYTSDSQVGVIAFAGEPTDDLLIGAMYYQGTGPCGQWVPAVPKPDICEIGGTQFAITFDNDKTLQTAIKTLGESAVQRNRTDLKRSAIFMQRDVGYDAAAAAYTYDGFSSIESWSTQFKTNVGAQIKASIAKAVDGLATNTQASLDAVVAALTSCINAGFASIATQLAENCGCDIIAPTCNEISIVLGTVALLNPVVNPSLDLTTEKAGLQNTYNNFSSLNNDLAAFIGEFDLPLIVSLGTIKDPCNPANTVTKNCTIAG